MEHYEVQIVKTCDYGGLVVNREFYTNKNEAIESARLTAHWMVDKKVYIAVYDDKAACGWINRNGKHELTGKAW